MLHCVVFFCSEFSGIFCYFLWTLLKVCLLIRISLASPVRDLFFRSLIMVPCFLYYEFNGNFLLIFIITFEILFTDKNFSRFSCLYLHLVFMFCFFIPNSLVFFCSYRNLLAYLLYKVELNYYDVRMFSIESIKKTKVPSVLYVYNQRWRSIISKTWKISQFHKW